MSKLKLFILCLLGLSVATGIVTAVLLHEDNKMMNRRVKNLEKKIKRVSPDFLK